MIDWRDYVWSTSMAWDELPGTVSHEESQWLRMAPCPALPEGVILLACARQPSDTDDYYYRRRCTAIRLRREKQ